MITNMEFMEDKSIRFNDCLSVSNLVMEDNNLLYDLEYDETIITEQEAKEMSESCILEMLDNITKPLKENACDYNSKQN